MDRNLNRHVLSASHLLIVSFKAGVSIFDDEGVLHWDRCRGCQLHWFLSHLFRGASTTGRSGADLSSSWLACLSSELRGLLAVFNWCVIYSWVINWFFSIHRGCLDLEGVTVFYVGRIFVSWAFRVTSIGATWTYIVILTGNSTYFERNLFPFSLQGTPAPQRTRSTFYFWNHKRTCRLPPGLPHGCPRKLSWNLYRFRLCAHS